MNRVLVSVEDGMDAPAWIPRAEAFVLRVLGRLGYDGEEISVLFCGDECIRALNAQYRGIDAPTDILSFEGGAEYTDEDGTVWRGMGDMVVSLETLPRNAAYFGSGEDEELRRLLIHGVLHLNGYDHGDEHIEPGAPPEGEMLSLQEALLSELAADTIL